MMSNIELVSISYAKGSSVWRYIFVTVKAFAKIAYFSLTAATAQSIIRLKLIMG